LVSLKWTQCIRFFNEFHYILLNHLNLLEYNYIVVPPLKLNIFMWKGVQKFLTLTIIFPSSIMGMSNLFMKDNVFAFIKVLKYVPIGGKVTFIDYEWYEFVFNGKKKYNNLSYIYGLSILQLLLESLVLILLWMER